MKALCGAVGLAVGLCCSLALYQVDPRVWLTQLFGRLGRSATLDELTAL